MSFKYHFKLFIINYWLFTFELNYYALAFLQFSAIFSFLNTSDNYYMLNL